jgi:DNA modification methylase
VIELHCGDCLDFMKGIESGSVDAVVTDPPYPEISRKYGRMTEAEWTAMMHAVVIETRRILKPRGSAVFILQPNSRKVGSMRAWLFEFQAWCCKEWNMVQDFYWWNHATAPTVHCQRIHGLSRPSVKPCVWLGTPDCCRYQDEILWTESDSNRATRLSQRHTNDLVHRPSGMTMRTVRCANVAEERGGTTPFNLIPIANSNSTNSAGSHGHGAGTPHALCDWWIRYLTKPGDVVADWFMGSGTTGLAAIARDRSFVGIERDPAYFALARARIDAAQASAASA